MASLLASRLCGSTTLRVTVLKQVPYKSALRTYAEEGKNVVTRVARRRTLKEQMLAPAGEGGLLNVIYSVIPLICMLLLQHSVLAKEL